MKHEIWFPLGREQTVDLDAVKEAARRNLKRGDYTTIHYHAYRTDCTNAEHEHFIDGGGSDEHITRSIN